VVDYLDRAVPLFERPPYNPDNHGWLAAIRGEAHASGASVLLTGEIGNWNLSAAPNSLLADFIRQGRLAHWWRESRAMLRDGRARLRGVAATSFGPWLPTPVWKSVLGLASAGTPQMALRPDYRDQLAAEIEDRHFGALARPRDIRLRARTAYREMDFGQYRKGILAGWNIDKRDATADRRLIEFCLALPLDMLLSNGTRRPLARAALADRLPAAVLDERRKGLQAADWYLDLQREKPKIEALIDRIEHHPAAGALIDTDLLWRWVRDWPSGDWHRPDLFARYRVALPFALAAGHFAIHASG
jgi:asparagine synthase (glutamine-hydrolysing)